MLVKKCCYLFMVVTMTCMIMSSHALAITALGTPAPQQEAVSRSFDFYPAETGWGTTYEPTIESGKSAKLTALLGNTGNIPQDFHVYALNTFTADGGGLGVAEDGSDPNEVTRWLDFPDELFALEPGKGIEISFSINVPGNTKPGEYVTAIAGEHASPNEIEGSEVFTQKLRYVIPIFITVPGDMNTAFEIGNVSLTSGSDRLVATIPIANTGNTHIRPEGTMQLSDQDGQLLASVPIGPAAIFSGNDAEIMQSIPQSLPGTTFQAHVELTDPGSGVTVTKDVENLIAAAPATPPPPPPITIVSTSITPNLSPDNVQFITVEATISNTTESIDAQLSLLSYLDGEQVERFPISQSLSLQQGETPITTRYIPLEGWTSGEWTFELLLETIDPGTGAAVVIDSQPIEGSVTIP